ncbi:mRNA cleavage and polyadenylation factor CLP1 [Candida viswanathii]|uniref:Polynucleotide 5'-hydroxyl-kinase GRC3 n=1 Tax=Candida viswanathii TaxID=5486 RepID=A0A367XNR3_9ASCO|nr:mRNA cleavage and polyadenylation factor CLP1 [Candida viswanathii]
MSIPGFGNIEQVNDEISNISITIPEGNEWRIEVPFNKILKLKVVSGILEINGTELANNVQLQFSGTKTFLYSPVSDSVVEYSLVDNKDDLSLVSSLDEGFLEYLSDDSNMNSIVNLHMYLESKRQLTKDFNFSSGVEQQQSGPRVMIIGSKASGKTSVLKTLVSYANKMNSTPILVNLQPRDGVFALPGSLTATPISDFFDIESCNGYGFTTTSGTLLHNPKQPVVKNFGMVDFNDNLDLYKLMIEKLGITVLSRLDQDLNIKNSGIIVDTPPLNLKNFDVIESIVSNFLIDHIIVVGNERLAIELNKKFAHKLNQLSIIKLSKLSGCVDVEDKFIRLQQEQTIKEYFNGNFKTRLSPFKTDIELLGLKIYKNILTQDLISQMAFLPAGDDFEKDENSREEDEDDKELAKYYLALDEPNSSNLDNSIVAITHLSNADKKIGRDLLNTSVMGYIHVSKFDDEKKRLKILLPFPGVFPKNVLISTNIGYSE